MLERQKRAIKCTTMENLPHFVGASIWNVDDNADCLDRDAVGFYIRSSSVQLAFSCYVLCHSNAFCKLPQPELTQPHVHSEHT